MTEGSGESGKSGHPVREQTIAGLIVLAVGAVATWAFGLLSEAKVPIGWYFVGVAAVGFVATFIYPPWRREIWGNVAKWRPLTTTGTIEAARAHARASLQDELTAKRSRPLVRAQWLIVSKKGERLAWVLANVAKESTAKHVSIDVPGAYFRPTSALDWESIDGGNNAEFFGALTQSGHDYRFSFEVSWTDANDERQSAVLPHES